MRYVLLTHSKRCGTNPRNGYNRRPLAVGAAQASGNARAQVRLGRGTGDVHSAVEQTVNQRADDFGAVQHFAALAADIDGESIEVDDLTVEQDD